MAKKAKYTPSPWSYIKPKEDNRRKLTLFVAGAMPPHLPERLDRLTAKYEVVTVMCAGYTDRNGLPPDKKKSEMEQAIEDWARERKQNYDIIPWGNINAVPGWVQFMGPDGNKAVITYDDGTYNGDDIKFAESLSKEKNVQYKKIEIPKAQNISDGADFADAVANIPMGGPSMGQ